MSISGYVYIVHALGTKRYKIGRARDPNKRFERLKQQSPFPLKLLGTFFTEDCVTQEKRLHTVATVYQTHGEWFELPDTWVESLEDWFYNPDCQKYKGGAIQGNLIHIVSAFDNIPLEALPKESKKPATYEQIERAIALLGHCCKGVKLTPKTKKELIAILGAYPTDTVQATIWKAKLKTLLKDLRSGVRKALRF